MSIKDRLGRAIILWSRPKDYLYSFFVSNKKTVRQRPYDPRAKNAAVELSEKIKNKCPGLETHLFGSLGLEIPGQNDIDLFITGKPGLAGKYVKIIDGIAGQGGKERPGVTEWKFDFRGFRVDLTLSCDNNKYFREQKYLFEAIKNDKKVLEAYSKLKASLNGKSQREYVIERMLFFNQIIAIRNKRVDFGNRNLVAFK